MPRVVKVKIKMAGVTMLELLLVIVIGVSFILFAINQFQQYNADQNALQIRYNADSILEAMAYYYQANCPEGAQNTLSQTPFPAVFDDNGNLYTDLTKGFLPGNWQPLNPLIDSTATNGGYFVQFNYVSPGNKKFNVCYPYWSTGAHGTQACTPPQELNNSPVVIWQEQLAIKMLHPAATLGYIGLTGADCAVDTLPTGAPVDCSQASSSGQPAYLVWQRLPSFASPAIMGDQWVSQPSQKGFNQLYTHDVMYELFLNKTNSGPNNYLCGG